MKKDSHLHKVGEMLPEELRVFRFSVVEAFLSAGIPLRKVDYLRDLLEKNGYRLTASSALSELIPTVRAMEVMQVRAP